MDTIYETVLKSIILHFALGFASGTGVVWFLIRYHVEKTLRKLLETELKPQFDLMHRRIDDRLTKVEFQNYKESHKEWGVAQLDHINENFERIHETLQEIKGRLK